MRLPGTLRPLAALAVVLLAWNRPLFAEIRASSEVDRTALRAGENLTLTLRIEGILAIPQPVLPPLDGFRSAGQYQTVDNAPQGKVIQFHYLLTPTRSGRISVPPIQISIAGRAMTVEGFSVSVEAAPKAPAGNLAAPARPLRPGDLLLWGECIPSKAYVGQGMTYSLHLLAKPSVRRLEILNSPDFGGFQRVEDPRAASLPASQRRHDGQTYLDQVLKRYVLFPLQAGELHIGDFRLSVVVEAGDLPGQTTDAPLSGGGTSVAVVSPPPPPAGFPGAVGDFQLSLEGEAPKEARLGDPFTLTFRVDGTGFLPAEPIRWPESPLFQRYPPTTSESSSFESGTYRVRRTIAISYLPQVAGPASLGPAALVFFDPGERRYRTITSGGFSLTVGGTGPARSGSDIALRPLIPVPRPSAESARPFDPRRFLLLLALPFLGSLLLWSGQRLYEGFLADPAKVRQRRLRRALARHLARGRRNMDTRKHEAFHDHLTRALDTHMDLALGKPASGLSRSQLKAALEAVGFDSEYARQVADFQEGLEAARYAPGQPDLRDLQDRYETLLRLLHRPDFRKEGGP